MADQYDVDGRLNEGLPNVNHSQSLTSTAHKHGFNNPDLTANESQLLDWYKLDEGMDLGKLTSDAQLFGSAVTKMSDAAETQHTQTNKLKGLWEGDGAEAANTFIKTHNTTADSVVKEFGLVQTGLGSLRDALWRIVDGKVQTAISVDGEAPAGEASDEDIKKYVETKIQGEWLPAMQKAWGAEGSAYDTFTSALGQDVPADFQTPGQLGPEWTGHNTPAGTPTNTPNNNGTQSSGDDSGGSGGDTGSTGTDTGTTGTETDSTGTDTGSYNSGDSGYGSTGTSNSGSQSSDPSSMISGLTSGLTEGLSSVGEMFSGLAGGLTEALQSIPFDQMAQGGDGLDGLASQASDDATSGISEGVDGDPDTRLAAAKEDAISEAQSDAVAPTDGKADERHGVMLAGAGPADSPEGAIGQTSPGGPPSTGAAPAAQGLGGAQQLAPAVAAPAASPLPAAGPVEESVQPQARVENAAGETPCEIAADELPKVGR